MFPNVLAGCVTTGTVIVETGILPLGAVKVNPFTEISADAGVEKIQNWASSNAAIALNG